MAITESPTSKPETVMEQLATWLVPVVLIGIALAGYKILGEKKDVSKKAPDSIPAPLVMTVPVKEHTDPLDIILEGKVVPHKEVIISSQVSGNIQTKKDICRPGRFVKKDTVLLEIDSEDYDIELQQAEQDLAQAGISIKENALEIKNTEELVNIATQDFELREKSLKRMESLSGRSAISEAEMDSEKRNLLTSKNSLQTLKNQLALLKVRADKLVQSEKIAQTKLDKAKLNLKRTKIVAPVSGVIVTTNVEDDSLVQPGMELLRIEDTSAVEIHTQIEMKDLYWIWQQPSSKERQDSLDYEIPKSPATVTYELEGTQFEWKGRLERFEGIGLDEKTRTVACRIIVENPREVSIKKKENTSAAVENRLTGPPALVRGMYVDVEIHVKPDVPLLSLEDLAIQPGNKVWLVREGKLEILPVQIAQINNKRAILNGLNTKLKAGDQVVTSPLPNIENGMAVEINKPEETKEIKETSSEESASQET